MPDKPRSDVIEPMYDAYIIDGGAFRNLLAVKRALYSNDFSRLTGDEIRDLANKMDASLDRAAPVKDDST